MRKFSVTNFLFCKGANFFELRAECPLRHLPSKCCSPNLPQKSNTSYNDVLSSQMSVLVCVGFKKKKMTSGFGIFLHLICTGVPKVGSKSWNSISNHPRGAAGVLPRKTNPLPSPLQSSRKKLPWQAGSTILSCLSGSRCRPRRRQEQRFRINGFNGFSSR